MSAEKKGGEGVDDVLVRNDVSRDEVNLERNTFCRRSSSVSGTSLRPARISPQAPQTPVDPERRNVLLHD